MSDFTTLPEITVTPDQPNVPNVPGVPPVNFSPLSSAIPNLATQPLTSDLVSQFAAVFGPQWGIFLNGVNVITADSVVGFEFRQDYTISDYPVENGTLESYDKVLTPYLAKVRFAAGLTATSRSTLLSAAAAQAATLQIYSAVTPEFTYPSCNISHYDYKRTASSGVGLIVVDVWVSQIIQQNPGGLPFGQVQNPASADSSAGGTVQPIPLQFPSGSLG